MRVSIKSLGSWRRPDCGRCARYGALAGRRRRPWHHSGRRRCAPPAAGRSGALCVATNGPVRLLTVQGAGSRVDPTGRAAVCSFNAGRGGAPASEAASTRGGPCGARLYPHPPHPYPFLPAYCFRPVLAGHPPSSSVRPSSSSSSSSAPGTRRPSRAPPPPCLSRPLPPPLEKPDSTAPSVGVGAPCLLLCRLASPLCTRCFRDGATESRLRRAARSHAARMSLSVCSCAVTPPQVTPGPPSPLPLLPPPLPPHAPFFKPPSRRGRRAAGGAPARPSLTFDACGMWPDTLILYIIIVLVL